VIPPTVFSIFSTKPQPLTEPNQPAIERIAMRENEITWAELFRLRSLIGCKSAFLGLGDWREWLSFHDLPTLGPPGNLMRHPTSGQS